MMTLPHPTHARNVRIGTVLLLLAMPPLILFARADSIRASWLSFWLLFLWLGWWMLGMSVTRCPQCRRVLTRRQWSRPLSVDPRNATLLFECGRCGVLWDTGFRSQQE